MEKYMVSIPIAGSIDIEVEAEDEASAIKAAWEVYGNTEGDMNEAHHVTWEAYEELVSGNCLHVNQNEIEVSSDG